MSWLEINGKIRTRILTPNTTYAVYLITNVSHRRYGLDSAPAEVSVEVSNKVLNGKAYLYQNIFIEDINNEIRVPSKRDDGWMEIELGEFLCGEADEEVKVSVREVGYQLKGGLIVEGIEVRPKILV